MEFQAGDGTVLTHGRRLKLLRRLLAPEQQPDPATAAACLLLLYAQPLTRIHRLTTSDILDSDGQMHIRFGDPPAPVPAPLADILRQLPRDLETHPAPLIADARTPPDNNDPAYSARRRHLEPVHGTIMRHGTITIPNQNLKQGHWRLRPSPTP